MGKKNNVFYPQLDSLRAIAVILVIISHWFAQNNFLNRYTNNGTLGVTLFFVLSGFLITGILLASKLKIEQGSSISQAFKIFYIRRSLRIFPVYYLLLFVLLIFSNEFIKDSFWWHFFYGSNFYFWIEGEFGGSLSHLWSLAVEEQFYLIWPAVILLLPRKLLPLVFIAGICGAVVFRYCITTPENNLGRILMPGSLDSFCMGGLLIYGRRLEPVWYRKYLNRRYLFVLLSCILLVLLHTPLFKINDSAFQQSIYYLLISIVFGIWIDRVSDTVEWKPVKYILSNPALLYLGKISYGVYLFHNFIPYFYGLDIPGTAQPLPDLIIQLLRFIALIGLSSLSWLIVEKPFLKLKKYYNYSA